MPCHGCIGPYGPLWPVVWSAKGSSMDSNLLCYGQPFLGKISCQDINLFHEITKILHVIRTMNKITVIK